MASALASPPPPWSFGSADLKWNARKFLERALVISALVHLAAVGVFRGALERYAVTDHEIVLEAPHWSDGTFVTPPLEPFTRISHPAAGASSDRGVVDPIDENEIRSSVIRGQDISFDPINDPGFGSKGGSTTFRPPPPPEPARGFTHADTPPVPLDAPKPVYTDWLREARIEGQVVLRVLVGTDGRPKQVDVLRGPKGLSEEAVKAVWRWTFRPGLSDHHPVEVWVQVPVVFSLE